MVVGTDWANEVRDMLASRNAVQVEAVNPNTEGLALQTCLQFDAVLVFSSSGFSDPDEVGDVLADYIDAGGGVVVAAIAGDSDSHGVGGRYDRADYHAMRRGERSHDARHTLGRKLVPDHPVLLNVSSFDGGPQSWRVKTAVSSSSSSRLLAEWEDGIPLLAERLIRGRFSSLSLNIWPPSRAISKDGWETFSDGDRLLSNSLFYVANVCPPLLSFHPSSFIDHKRF